MTEQLDDVWLNRDLRVLIAAARLLDDDPFEPVGQDALAVAAGLDEATTLKAMAALDKEFLTIEWTHTFGGPSGFVRGMTVQARQTVGLWPSAEGAFDRLLGPSRRP